MRVDHTPKLAELPGRAATTYLVSSGLAAGGNEALAPDPDDFYDALRDEEASDRWAEADFDAHACQSAASVELRGAV